MLLAAFLGSFLFIRTSARLIRSPKAPWWPGSVKTSSGLHLHHLVWGIVLMMLAGFLGFTADPTSPETEILAALFGVGLGLTLDEFALWIHLRDVYWAEEGRSSLDAVIVATVIGGLLVLGVAPFDIPRDASSVDTVILAVVTDVLLATLAILKGRRPRRRQAHARRAWSAPAPEQVSQQRVACSRQARYLVVPHAMRARSNSHGRLLGNDPPLPRAES